MQPPLDISSSRPGIVLDRGVHLLPFIDDDDREMLVAITRDHRLIAGKRIPPNDESAYRAAYTFLLAKLEEADPVPQLRVVRGNGSSLPVSLPLPTPVAPPAGAVNAGMLAFRAAQSAQKATAALARVRASDPLTRRPSSGA